MEGENGPNWICKEERGWGSRSRLGEVFCSHWRGDGVWVVTHRQPMCSRVQRVQRLCIQSDCQCLASSIPPKLVLVLNKQNVGVKNASMAGSRGCMTCCQRGLMWR